MSGSQLGGSEPYWLGGPDDNADYKPDCDTCRGLGRATCPTCGNTEDCPDCDGSGKREVQT